MSDVTLLAGAGIFAAGMITGRFWPARKRRAPKPVKPVCGCHHEISFHDPATGRCRVMEKHVMRYDKNEMPVYEPYPCDCQKYTGPEPLPEYYAPELTP